MRLIFTLLILFHFTTAAVATNITITGPQSVCPATTNTYTAKATTAFGWSRQGTFRWEAYYNILSLGSQLLLSEGVLSCSSGSSATSTFTLPYTVITGSIRGTVEIRVSFMPTNDIGCNIFRKTYTINVGFPTPGPISGLVFCTPGETKTVSVRGLNYTLEDCYYHFQYDWIVPPGWTVTAPGSTSIPNGIRTFAKSVSITAPMTLMPRKTGNYTIKVKTSPAAPHQTESVDKIWVGPPTLTNYNYSISGVPQFPDIGDVCPNGYGSFSVAVPSDYPIGAPHSIQWTSNYATLSMTEGTHVTATFGGPVGSYASVGVTTVGECGTWDGNYTLLQQIGNCSGGGGGVTMRVAYPNPATDMLTVETQAGQTVQLMDEQQQVRYTQVASGNETKVPVGKLPKGTYYLTVKDKKSATQQRILIER